MVRTIIFGVTGYTGVELVRLLAPHPDVVIAGGSSQQWAGKQASEVFPSLGGVYDFTLSTVDDLQRVPADLAFLALPHGESAKFVRPLLDAGVKVVDLSADCRLHDPKVYGEWYGPHQDPGILPQAIYGLPEIHRAEIAKASLVANPGCYPTCVILGVAPLISQDWADTSVVIADSKSGISGAGRGTKLTTSFCEAGEGFKPYSIMRHRHIPEMEQELTLLKGEPVRVRFSPHLIPVSRGMVSTIYLPLKGPVAADTIREHYDAFYSAEPFVQVLSAGVLPDTLQVRGTNMCHVAVEVDDRTGILVVVSALDNLTKGASGMAVQNMNIMMGLKETEGLTGLPLFP
ncbi:MAG: N-acetyl-gamma-glutamyl-phosphate reductase [Thermodesulfobacteriota bacterium]